MILAHGSRNGETEATLEKITEYVREEPQMEHVEPAYMEFREVNLEKGMLRLMENGVTDIRIVPYFLFEGIHIKEDIPAEIAAFKAKHPQVNVEFGKTLGADRRLAMVLADRVRETLQ